MLHFAQDDHIQLGPLPHHSAEHKAKIFVDDVSFWYGQKQALKRVSLEIYANEVTVFLGPSGCGKTTLLRCFNRMNEIVNGSRMEGRILVDSLDIYAHELDASMVRRRFGWIAQRPNPFPWSIRANIVYSARLLGLVADGDDTEALVERSLRSVGMWYEVKDRLKDSAIDLSIGQQQRLCIARAIATHPEVLLMDEPCSALDPVATALIEKMIGELRTKYTIVIITHNLQQAARVSQRAAFFHLGDLLEAGDTSEIFLRPKNARCQAYVTGRYG